MWNNVIFGFLLIATVCTQCHSFGYPKVRPNNPLQLPSRSYLYQSTNVLKGSAVQQSTNTVQTKNDTAEQNSAADHLEKSITIPQVKVLADCTHDHDLGYPKVRPENPLQLPPPSVLYESTNVLKGSAVQQSTNTLQTKEDTAEQTSAADQQEKSITIPQVKVPADCTHHQGLGYPKVRPDNPLQLPPPSDLYESTNTIMGSAIQQSTNTAQSQDDTPEENAADDKVEKTITIPRVKIPADSDQTSLIPQVTEQPEEDDINEPQQVEHVGHHHGEDGAYNPRDDGTGWDIRKSVPGEPGRDYPTYDKVISTSFTCGDKEAGYYADLESRCQIFRVCTTGSVNAFNSFLCPNGSLFNQVVLTCDWWPNVDCQGSAAHYNNSKGDIPQDLIGKVDVRYMLEAPLLHPYKPGGKQNDDRTSITNNRISDTKIFNNYRVTPEQDAVTEAEKRFTSKIRYTTPNIRVSTFESTPTTGAPIIQSSTPRSSTQQFQTGTYDVNEKTTTDSLFLHAIPGNPDGNVPLISTKQSQSLDERTSSRASFTSDSETTVNTGSRQTSGPVFLSTSKTMKLQMEQPLFTSEISSSENDKKNVGTLAESRFKGPPLHVSPVVSNQNSPSTDEPVSAQNTPVTFDQTNNVNEPGPEKITLLASKDQKQGGELLHKPNVFGPTLANSGLNVQTGSSVDTNTEKKIIGGLNIGSAGRLQEAVTLRNRAFEGETNKQNVAGISKSIELPVDSQRVQTSGGGTQQHYARILNQGNEHSTTGTQNGGGDVQNQPDHTIKQFENQRNQYAGVFNHQNSQSGTQQQALHNQAPNKFVVPAQNIHNGGITSVPARFNAQSQGVQSNFGLPNRQQTTQHGYNMNQGFTGETQNVGLQNQQGFQSNFGLGVQNVYKYNQGFAGDAHNHGAYNLGTLNNQNAFSNQNSFISNQNAHGADGFKPHFHEQNYQNFNFYTQNNGQNANNYEVAENGAAQNYKGEGLSQYAHGHAHTAYSGHNYAYKESTKVEVVPSLGFTLTDELGRASYASALINGLVQEKRGAPSANYDVRYSSYQGPSSYLVPQSSVQRLSNEAKRASYY